MRRLPGASWMPRTSASRVSAGCCTLRRQANGSVLMSEGYEAMRRQYQELVSIRVAETEQRLVGVPRSGGL